MSGKRARRSFLPEYSSHNHLQIHLHSEKLTVTNDKMFMGRSEVVVLQKIIYLECSSQMKQRVVYLFTWPSSSKLKIVMLRIDRVH